MNRAWRMVGMALAASAWIALAAGVGRGEMEKEFKLDGTRVVPPNETPATGVAVVILRGHQGRVRLRWEGLSGRPTRFEIRGPALPGHSGGPLFLLSLPKRTLRTTDSLETTFTVAQSRKKLFRDELTYLNVRTVKYPRGEIRGQIIPTDEENDEDD